MCKLIHNYLSISVSIQYDFHKKYLKSMEINKKETVKLRKNSTKFYLSSDTNR